MLNVTNLGLSVGEHQRDYLYTIAITKDPAMSSMVPDYTAMKGRIDLYNAKGVFPGHKTANIQVKWGGENYNVAGVDETTKTGELTFRLDEASKIYQFWHGMKQLTGDEYFHVNQLKVNSTFNMLVSMISVNKETITTAVELIDAMVLSVGDISPDKEGSGIATFTVGLCWDRDFYRPELIGKNA